MEIKKIMKVAGKIGAGLLGLGGLILAGKSGFGENLKLGGGVAEPDGDLADTLVDLDADVTVQETPEPDPTEEEETSDE